MAPIDQKTEVVPPAEVPEDLPLPADPKVIFLGGLFVLAVLAAAYVVSEIVLPLVFAIVLKLLLQPASRALERLHVPRILAALLLTSIPSSLSSHSCSGSGFGVFRAASSRCRCWRLLRLSATVFSRWPHSVIFLRDETQRRVRRLGVSNRRQRCCGCGHGRAAGLRW
jgi:hypothetical protein